MSIGETTQRARALLDRKLSDEASVLGRLRRGGDSSAEQFFSGMIEGAFLVAAADGEMSEDEEATLAETIRFLTGEVNEPEEFLRMIESFAEALEQDGFDRRLRELTRSLPDEGARREVMTFAVLVALCDRHLAEAEWTTLLAMGKSFGLGREVIEGVVSEAQQGVR